MNARSSAKRTVKAMFLLLVAPAYLLFRLLCLICNPDSTFQAFSQAISLVPGKLGGYLRAAFYRLACPNTSDDISIGFLTVFSHSDTTLHPGVYIGPQCNIGKCSIGENTLIGSGVHILSGNRQHEFRDASVPIQEQGGSYDKIAIGEDCWIGNSAVVMAELKPHSIVAAGSIVTKSFESGDILAGNPAKPVKNRFNSSPSSAPCNSTTGAA